jgi:hypothetical protein
MQRIPLLDAQLAGNSIRDIVCECTEGILDIVTETWFRLRRARQQTAESADDAADAAGRRRDDATG